MSEPLLLCRRLKPAPAAAQPGHQNAEPHHPSGVTPGPAGSAGAGSGEEAAPLLLLALSAAERQRLRGHCRSACGRDLLLQLPRGGGPLEPGERLAAADGTALVRVEAAAEELLRVRSDDPFTLLRAAFHLGNRHVALELRQGELRLLQDPVLAELLRGLGVSLEAITAPFEPENGAYASGHSHSHSHDHDHDHDHSRSQGHSHSHSHSPEADGEASGRTQRHSHGAGSGQADPPGQQQPQRP